MKIVQHERRPTINSIKLRANPLIVWLGTRTQLRIKKGDKLEDVARLVQKKGPWKVDIETARQIVAYWFALGERQASGRMGTKWRTKELRSERDRLYLG